MGKIEITTKELATLVKPYLPKRIQEFKGTETGFSITTMIPLVHKEISIDLLYKGFRNETIFFETPSGLLNKFYNNFIASEMIKNLIYFDGNQVGIETNKLFSQYGLIIRLIDFEISNHLVKATFDMDRK